MTVEEQLAAALAQVENLRMTIAEKGLHNPGSPEQAPVAPQESLRSDEREGTSRRSLPAVAVR